MPIMSCWCDNNPCTCGETALRVSRDLGRPAPLRMVPSTEGAKVYCVICMDGDPGRDAVHIFSTQEKATAFADADTSRDHVLYDYVIDCPERMEGRTQ